MDYGIQGDPLGLYPCAPTTPAPYTPYLHI